MNTRKPPSEFAKERGRLIRRAREDRTWSQAKLGEEIGVTREAVSQYESGKIEHIDLAQCRGLVAKLGLEPSTVTRDLTMFQNQEELPGISAEARRVARLWDSLPDGLRRWLAETVDSYDRLRSKHPAITQLLSAPVKTDPQHTTAMADFTHKHRRKSR